MLAVCGNLLKMNSLQRGRRLGRSSEKRGGGSEVNTYSGSSSQPLPSEKRSQDSGEVRYSV